MKTKISPQWTMILSAFVIATAVMIGTRGGDTFTALIFGSLQTTPGPAQWKTFDPAQVDSGATIPPATNVIIHLPSDIKPIDRYTLFGPASTAIRYWGYCFPEDGSTPPPGQLPGKVFLSEAERKWRDDRVKAGLPTYSIYHPPKDVETLKTLPPIRHQMEIFQPGATCYVMTSSPLPLGSDRDGDGLNIQLEKSYGTDPNVADTDQDGVTDGNEVFHLHTDPKLRDTDSDGLPDGIEDKNLNGYHDSNETDPKLKDSDGDGLCDGYCQVRGGIGKLCHDNQGQDCIDVPYTRWMGEDKNLNGAVDAGETDPMKIDSLGDGILDSQRYYNCLLAGTANC